MPKKITSNKNKKERDKAKKQATRKSDKIPFQNNSISKIEKKEKKKVTKIKTIKKIVKKPIEKGEKK